MNPIVTKLTPTKPQRSVVSQHRGRIATAKAAYERASAKATKLEAQSEQFQERRELLKRSSRHDRATAKDLSILEVQIETIAPQLKAACDARDEALSRWRLAVNESARYVLDEFGPEMQRQLNAAVAKAIEPFYSSTERARHQAEKGLAGYTDASLALTQFLRLNARGFQFQSANDESLIETGSAQISATLESIIAGRPVWTFK